MKEVFEQYGSVWIAMIIAVAIISLLLYGVWNGRSGLGQVSGEFLTAGNQNQLNQTGSLTYRQLRERKKPVIQLQISGVQETKPMGIQEMFAAKDAEGNTVEIQVLKVKKDGIEESTWNPQESGMYEVWLEAKDAQGMVTQKTAWIPVQMV